MPTIKHLDWAVLQPPQKPRPAWNFSTGRLRRKRKSQVVKYRHEENKDNPSEIKRVGAGAAQETERENKEVNFCQSCHTINISNGCVVCQ